LNDTQAGNLFLCSFCVGCGSAAVGVLLSRLGFRPAFLLGLLLMAVASATLYMDRAG